MSVGGNAMWLELAAALLVIVIVICAALTVLCIRRRRRRLYDGALRALFPLLGEQSRLDVQRCVRELAQARYSALLVQARMQHLAWQREAEAAVRLAGRPGAFADRVTARAAVVFPMQRRPERAVATAATPSPAHAAAVTGSAGAGDAWAAGATVAAAGAYDIADWWRGEPALLDAIGRVTETEIANGAQMWAQIGPGGRDWMINENTVRSIRGYVGETQAAELLEGAGLTVEWPAKATQAGHDLLAQGHEVNVKVRADADSLDAHFARYPDIPVVVNEDMAGLPSDAIHVRPGEDIDPDVLVGENVVVVAEGLVLSGAQGITETGLVDNAEPLDESFAVAAPGLGALVIASRSAWREGRLAMAGDTDWLRAGRNVSIDVVVRGGSSVAAAAAAGLAVDAMFGGLLLGIPTLVATATAAAAGAKGGGAAAKYLREGELRQAREDAQDALAEYGEAVEAERVRVQRQAAAAEAAADEELRGFHAEQRRAYRGDVDAACGRVMQAARFDAAAVLRLCIADLQELCDRLDAEVAGPADAPVDYRRRALARAAASWTRLARRLSRDASVGGPGDVAFWDAMAAVPVGRALLDEQLERQRLEHQQARRQVVERGVLRAHATYQRRLQAQASVHRDRPAAIANAQQRLAPKASRLRSCHAVHLKELRAAGVTVPERPLC